MTRRPAGNISACGLPTLGGWSRAPFLPYLPAQLVSRQHPELAWHWRIQAADRMLLLLSVQIPSFHALPLGKMENRYPGESDLFPRRLMGGSDSISTRYALALREEIFDLNRGPRVGRPHALVHPSDTLNTGRKAGGHAV